MMKKLVLLFAFLLLIPMYTTAEALLPTQFSHPPKTRVMIDLPDGLDADAVYNETSGIYTVTVYVESTTDEEWSRALAAGYGTQEGYLYLNYGILPPENVEKHRCQGWGDSGLTEGEMIERLSQENASAGSETITASWEIGQYFANAQMLDLIPLSQSYGALNTVRWVFDNQTSDLYESVGLVIQFKKNRQSGSIYDPDMFKAVLPLMPGENIHAEAADGTDVTVQSGKVSFICGDSSKVMRNKVYLNPLNEAWTPYLENGEAVPKFDGRYRVMNDTLNSGTDVLNTRVVRITWRDNSGAEKAVHFLTIETIRGDVKPWPAYAEFSGADGLIPVSPFPKDRVDLSLTQDISGLSISYDEENGVVRFHADQETLSKVKDKDLAQAIGSIKLTAHPDAKAFVFQTYGGIIYGPGNEFLFSDWEPEAIDPSRIVPYDQTVDAFIERRTYRLADGSTGSYYVNASEHYMPYTGWLMCYCWLKEVQEDAQEIALEYIAVEYDPVMLETITPALESDDELYKNAGKPQVILKKGGNKNHYSLHAKQYPSSGNTHYYELRLIDQYGEEAFLEGEADVYLPYPHGYTMDNCHELAIEIVHYDKNGQAIKESFSVAEGTLEPKPYGLRFTVKDFSPFVMTWEVRPDAAALPQTGDRSSLLLYTALMGMSIFGILVIKKRYN